jgi:putative copper resistance protein D
MTVAAVAGWPFGFGVADLSLALARGLFVVSVLSSFGAALFMCLFAPLAVPEVKARCRNLVWASLVSAGVAGLAWLVIETYVIAETGGLAETVAAVPVVLLGTRFGQILALQCLALAGAGAATANGARARTIAAALAGVAALLEAGHSHAFAMAHGLSALLVSQSLHLVAAGAWLGGLLPLFTLVRGSPPDRVAIAARRFSVLGLASVATLAATALFQGWVLSGGLTGLTGTAYGTVLLIKAGLFAAMVVIAARNRFLLTPALATSHGERIKQALARSIAVETLLGFSIVLAAGVLGSLEPGMHLV